MVYSTAKLENTMSENTRLYWEKAYSDETHIELPEDIHRAVAYAHDFFGSIAGKRVLDIGCGHGGTSVFLARAGANVTAVDFSKAAVQNLTEFALKNDIKNLNAVAWDVMKIDELGTFDYVFGSLILHHVEPFAGFCSILRSTLASGGSAFFYENNAASDFLIWFRRKIVGKLWVPRFGNEDEFPLMPAEIEMLRQHFAVDVKIPEMIFFQLASSYLFKRKLLKPTKFIDNLLFQLNIGRKYSYRQYVLIRG